MKKLVQCASCPWKKGVDPRVDIPGGYCETKHHRLEGTIAREGDFSFLSEGGVRSMACHKSPVDAPRHCVGWLHNQLGPGNNIGLRLMRSRGMVPPYEVVGPQHPHFRDTLPGAGGDE